MSAPAARPAPGARYLLLGATLALAVGGLLMIWSASSAADFVQKHDSYYHVTRQGIFLLIGLAGMLVASRTSPAFARRLGLWVLAASDAGLLLVLAMGVGKFGATRWLDLGFTTLQPSEFARLGCVLVVAELMADRERRPRPIQDDLGKLALIVGVPFGLVMLQPDMGTAMSILLAVFFVMVLGGLDRKVVAGIAASVALAVPVLIMAASYRASRVTAFLNPYADPQGKGFQIIQASLAFGSGGLTGVGLGLSRQKFFYLPAAHTDFILAIIGEELGLAGTLAVVCAFGLLCYAGMRIALSVKDTYARLVAGGITVMIVLQAVINMASVTGLMPITGIPLPLVSYGGSSLVFTMGCVGLILAMTRGRDRAEARERPHVVDTGGSPGASAGERRRDGRPHLSGIDGGRARPKRRA